MEGASSTAGRRPLLFLVVTVAITLPFYALLAFDLPMPFGLPPTLVTIVLPGLVATVMTSFEAGGRGVARLWASLDPRLTRTLRPWLAAFLIAPLAALVDWQLRAWWGVGTATGGTLTPLTMAPAYFIAFMVGAIPEEIGWSGYATGPLASRWGILRAGLAIGLVWTAWHWIPYVSEGRPVEWIMGQALLTIALRIVSVWLFVTGGESTLLVCILHGFSNLAALYPSGFAESNPWMLFVGLLVVVPAAAAMAHLIDDRRRRNA
ncbi:MAG: CPBP family glutamic-type intramembrane protease [Actinomycetota bacterium]|nr:CPBP family glutamic-type intramembrane protease [Actinomycetota bacterium]